MGIKNNLNCVRCGRTLVVVPHELKPHETIKARWVVADNIEGKPPKKGDAVHLICKCGKVIIGFTPDYLRVEVVVA